MQNCLSFESAFPTVSRKAKLLHANTKLKEFAYLKVHALQASIFTYFVLSYKILTLYNSAMLSATTMFCLD